MTLALISRAALASTLLAAAAVAHAAPAATVFDFEGSPTSLAPTSAATHLSVSDITFSATARDGMSVSTGALHFSGADWMPGAVRAYMSFSVTVENGWEFDAASLSASAAALGFGSGFDLRSSADAYAASLFSTTLGSGYPNFQSYTANLDSIASLQNLTGTTTFRLYGTPAANYSDFVLDSLTLTGDVNPLTPVPEPQTYALMLAGLGVLGAVARRRRQARA